MTAVTRFVGAAAFALAMPLLAGCTASATEEPEESESPPMAAPSASAPEAPAGPADDPDLRRLMRDFDREVDIPGFVTSGFSPEDSAQSYYGSWTTVVDPAECAAFDLALDLGTEYDLTTASGDLINPVGLNPIDGEESVAGEPEAFIRVMTRVFGDPEVAATLLPALVDAECDVYGVTGTWEGGSHARMLEISDVVELELAGLGAPTVRVDVPAGDFVAYDADGGVELEGRTPSTTTFIHVQGPYGVAVQVEAFDLDEATVAKVIAGFFDYMAAG